MVDTGGPNEVASHRENRGEDRKVDQVVCELARYNVAVGALQETKWFGCDVYEMTDSVVLTSGRSTPAEGWTAQGGEGMPLVLRASAIMAWKRGGKQWKAWSSRCVSASLQVGRTTKTESMWYPVMHPREQQVERTRMPSSGNLTSSSLQCHQRRDMLSLETSMPVLGPETMLMKNGVGCGAHTGLANATIPV